MYYINNMKVYRFLSETELRYIKTRAYPFIGSFFKRKDVCTHKYKSTSRYLHFFKNKEDIKNIIPLYKDGKQYYICTFDIPMPILIFSSGYGYYKKDNSKSLSKCLEFAIDVKHFRTSWLKRIEKVECLNKQNIEMEKN